mmetsp:Transcript_18101/g.37964  ORF Transcript_18101/g.37964 Transcript_18101/m.37964 type:complete len:511 (+) Transcript_18101:128-1660(+)
MTQKSKMRSLSVSVALLTSAASSSTPASISATTTTSTVSLPNRRYPRPLAFATNHVHGRRFQPLPSQRIRKRALARSFLRAVPTADNKSEFTQRNHRRFNNNNNDNNYNNNNSQDPRQMEELSSPEIVHSLTNIDIHSKSNRVSPTSALGMVVDSQREFEINLGRAIDSLKNDYPKILSRNPDFRLYHDDLEVVDPTGVSLHGLANYKRAFAFIHGVVGLFYDEGKSGLTSIRVGYDWARKCIRVSWNVELVPRLLGTRNMLHVDGISEYYLDHDTGLINQHRVSHLVFNGDHVRPANGIFHALAEISPIDPESIPVYSKGLEGAEWTKLPFQTWNPLTQLFPGTSSSSLFADPSEQAMSLDAPPTSPYNPDYAPLQYDADALQRKNASRRKFGKPPLTPEEFIKIEDEVRAMDALNKKKATYLAEQVAQARKRKEEEKAKGDFLSNIFGGVFKNGCESNFDCERPQVCCDVGFKKICCSNGLGIVDGVPVERYPRGLLRVPLPNDNYDY